MKERILPEKWHILSGSALKMIAVITMLIDHIGYALLYRNPIPLFTVLGRTVTLYAVCRGIGRIAFPIFAFLLVEGFLHTRDRKRYAIGLGVFALLSEIPHDLMTHRVLLEISEQNIFFSLLLGLLGIWTIERFSDRPLRMTALLLALLAGSFVFRVDYKISGFCFILLLYVLRDRPILRAVIGTGVLSSTWKAGLAFVPIALYNGKRGFIKGRILKYAFYLFYPVHLLILYWIGRSIYGV